MIEPETLAQIIINSMIVFVFLYTGFIIWDTYKFKKKSRELIDEINYHINLYNENRLELENELKVLRKIVEAYEKNPEPNDMVQDVKDDELDVDIKHQMDGK